MGKTFFTADLHLFHNNILKYCRRLALMEDEDRERFLEIEAGGEAKAEEMRAFRPIVETMNLILVHNINKVVGADDRLILIGDAIWAYGAKDMRKRCEWFRNNVLCKNVHLVYGNHDALPEVIPHRTLAEGEDRRAVAKEFFTSVHDQVMVECEDGIRVWCNHYPMVTWPDKHRSNPALHAYGHVHGAFEGNCPVVGGDADWGAMDVGVDVAERYSPYSAHALRALVGPKSVFRRKGQVGIAE